MERIYDGKAILKLPMNENDSGEVFVGNYLKELLRSLWNEKERFSGKRPFGNSGWENELAEPLIRAGVIPGDIDEDGYIDDYDDNACHLAILAAINAM